MPPVVRDDVPAGGVDQAVKPSRVQASDVLLVLLLVAIGLYFLAPGWFGFPALQAWSTVFVAICLQALPFLVLGVLVSAAVTALVPPSFFERLLPRSPVAAVPAAGAAGAVLPGCECASVPVAGSLVRRGVAPAAALAFLLSAPAINPVVVVATVVAFPGEPMMAVGRFVASLVVAVVMGWLWAVFGRPEWIRLRQRAGAHPEAGRARLFVGTAQHDFTHAGGFLVLGALAAATLNVVVPRPWLDALAENPAVAVLVLAVLAVVLAICSEADAFVAASLTSFSLTARLVFLVVGPVVDVKLIALQAGTFGPRFALRFAPVTFLVAVATALLVAWVLL
ncbi:permease [Blastococcus sp. MG754426]|uniref:permease n=1 Tax=unclassified Blastococcus TaxID=2619396 RepID=UPI001EF053CB|nr:MULTISPECIES: permease [unclassified Blastococcus]MCF6507616.1 permease [Blastococcus sp. MG754426]MCF6514315.1 permease [Blastococcus sp. MG754427]MCF6737639.1 permease [Blastococcus sp. KM273129]